MRFQLVEENELDKLANSAKKKNKKKHQQGWFVTLGGNPEKNAEMFNTATNTGDAPTSGCSEGLNEQLKNEYEICYLDYKDHKYFTYIDAYSEKQAALIFRKTNKHVKKIVYIDCIKDHSQDDGEQLKLFKEETMKVTKLDEGGDHWYHFGDKRIPSGVISVIKDAYKNKTGIVKDNQDQKITISLLLKKIFPGTDGFELHHFNLDHSDNSLSNLYWIPSELHRKLHDKNFWSKVIFDVADQMNVDIGAKGNKEIFIEKLPEQDVAAAFVKNSNEMLEGYYSLAELFSGVK